MTSVLLDLLTKLTIDRIDGMLYIEMTNDECDTHQAAVFRRTGVLWCTVMYCDGYYTWNSDTLMWGGCP